MEGERGAGEGSEVSVSVRVVVESSARPPRGKGCYLAPLHGDMALFMCRNVLRVTYTSTSEYQRVVEVVHLVHVYVHLQQ